MNKVIILTKDEVQKLESLTRLKIYDINLAIDRQDLRVGIDTFNIKEDLIDVINIYESILRKLDGK